MNFLLKILPFTLILTSCGVKPEFNSSAPFSPPILPSKIQGCTFSKASNFNVEAEEDNGECSFSGCSVFDSELRSQFASYSTLFPSSALSDTCPAIKNEVFNQNNQPHIGILWVVDNSFSMGEEQRNLGNNFNSFINSFINTRLKFTMAITTTDSKPVYQSLLLLTSEQARLDRNKFINDFKSLIKVGTNGSSYEKGYQASYNFLNDFASQLLTTPDSNLAVIYVSDEADGSSKSADYYITHLRSKVANNSKFQAHAILDLDNSGGDDDSEGEKYLVAVNKTKGVSGDLDENFAKVLTNIGNSILNNLLDSFALSTVPYEPSIEVFVNGVKVTNWQYDAVRKTIKFLVAPAFNSEVIVKYMPKI